MKLNKKMLGVFIAGCLMMSHCGMLNVNVNGAAKASGDVKGKAKGKGKVKNNCPKLGSIEAISKVNIAQEFKLDKKNSARLESALVASAELRGISAQIEADLKRACGQLARDLDANPGKNAKSACRAAATAIKQFKAKARGKLVVDVVPPRCTADVDVMSKCAAKCDANIQPGKVDVKCEGGELSGVCDAKCSGTCDLKARAKCSGTCRGSCSAGFFGTCNGKCDGKCDGKSTNGSADCQGRCEGSCDTGANGSCSGSCEGQCDLSASAKCDGTCTGSCSVEMKAPKCTGQVKPPKMSAECKAECNAKVNAKMKCVPARVSVKVVGAADADAAGKLVATLKANLPQILKVSMGMKRNLVKATGNIKSVINGVSGSFSAMAKGSAQSAMKLTSCVTAPIKAAIDAAGKITANVNVSVEVQASVNASANTR